MTYKIFVQLSPSPLGDFIAYALLAASIRELFDDSELFIYYRDDRPYKKPIAECIHNAKVVLSAPPDHPGLAIDYFNHHHGRPVYQSELLEDNNVWRSNLILTGAMLDDAMLNSIPITILRPQKAHFAQRRDQLVALGLDPNKWVACVYWKENGYEFRREHYSRTIYDPSTYMAVIGHIIDNLGGQVVRLGHPTPTKMKPTKGLVDLAHVPDSEALQLFAVSISRFFIASGSGPASYGPAFGVPTAVTDQTLCYGVWRDHDYVLTQNIFYEDRFIRQMDAYDAGYLYTEWRPTSKIGYLRNTAAELIEATNEMFNITTDCTGWRTLVTPPPPSPLPNKLTFPIPCRYRPELLIPPSLRKK